VLRHTFQQLPGVRERTERKLWQSGILHWSDLGGYAPPRVARAEFDEAIERTRAAWETQDCAWFGANLPAKEAWRLYHNWFEHAAYLDIETTGSSRSADAITCVAVATRRGIRMFTKDRNLDEFPEAIRDAPILVTFNGQTFDLPFLRAAFGEDVFDRHAHFDVCIALRRLGHRGGLKRIEKELCVPRDDGLDGVDGSLAVEFWHRHRLGDPRALPTLERYCAEDVLGLPAIAALATNALLGQTPFVESLPAVPVPRRIESYMSYSRELVAECLLARENATIARDRALLARETESQVEIP
jgi:hypothetical protein